MHSICIDLFLHTISNYCVSIFALIRNYLQRTGNKKTTAYTFWCMHLAVKRRAHIKSVVDRYAKTITLFGFYRIRSILRSNFLAYSSHFLLINYDLRWKKTGQRTHTGHYSSIDCDFAQSFVRNIARCCFFFRSSAEILLLFFSHGFGFLMLFRLCAIFLHSTDFDHYSMLTFFPHIFFLFYVAFRFDLVLFFDVLHLISHVVFIVYSCCCVPFLA